MSENQELIIEVQKDSKIDTSSVLIFKGVKTIPVYILCQNSIVKYPQINLKRLINNQYSNEEINLIKNSPLKFDFNSYYIKQLHINKKDIYIVNDKFLLNRGFNISNIASNINYYLHNGKIILWFINEPSVLSIENNKKEYLSINQKVSTKNNNIDNFYLFFSLCWEVKLFISSLNNLKKQFLDLSNINNIDLYLSQNQLDFQPVYLIETDILKYVLNSFYYSYFTQFQNFDETLKKDIIKRSIILPDFSILQSKVQIVSQDKINDNIKYSFVNEKFCKNMGLASGKYIYFKGLVFINQKNVYLYYNNPKNLLKILNYNNNSFKISKIKNDVNNINNFSINNNIQETKINVNNKTNYVYNINNANNPNNANNNYENIMKVLNEERRKNNNLIEDNYELKEKLKIEKENNVKLQDEIVKLKKTISQQKGLTKTEKLQQIVDSQQKEINNLQQKLNNNISSLIPGPKDYVINIKSIDNKVNYRINCKNIDIFVKIEGILYNEFPYLKDYNTYFMNREKIVKRFKTLDENKIKNEDYVLLCFFKENM